MRYDKRYTRTLTLITDPDIPRAEGGGIRLCHFCQRSVFLKGGFLMLLADDLRRLSMAMQ